MSTGVEPVSAFGVFQTAKTVSDGKKKSKKNHNAQSGNKGKDNQVKKEAMKPSGKKHNTSLEDRTKSSMVGKGKSAATAKPISAANQKNKAANVSVTKKAATKNKPGKIKDSEVVNLVEQLMGDPAKKLSKAEQKKKQDLENYLVKQLEKDEGAGSNEEGEDFESEDEDGSVEEGSEEDYSDSDSDEFSAEYTINESGSYTYELTGEDEGSENTDDAKSSTNEDDALVQDTTNKANRKRKSPEPAKSQAKSAAITTNGISEAKKSKKPQEQKAMTRKSLPATKVEKAKPEDPKRRKSLATSEVKGKGSTPNASVTTVNVKLEPLSPPHNVSKVSSIDEGKRSFKWLLNPVTVDDFFGKYWEAKACLIKRKQANYFSHLMSFEMIDQMLIKNHVEFTKNLDVTSYKNGVRETLNPEGRAMPPVVWDHYGQGCSIRLLNPQTFLPQLYTLNTTMQEYFHCLVGANAYLTPPNSQGFAPHYDDIEAFVMQIEGRKRWKLYKPRMPADILPRDSSHNFTQQEIGKPILDEVLEPGDVLYFPRGTIHQACTEPGYHSLHITLSVYQRQSYADLFEKMLPLMLKKAIATNVDMRRGLPLNTWSHAGIAFSDNSTKERADLQKKVTQLMHKCIKDMPLKDIMDAAVDQVAKKFQHEALPPEILPSEKLRTVFGSRNRTNERGECVCDYDIDERTNVRLLRANIMRLVDEEEKIRIYYYLDNSKEYCEYDPNFIEIEAMEAASVEVLIKSYPAYVGVSQLPLPSYEQKLNLVTALWERGLLMMEKPFK